MKPSANRSDLSAALAQRGPVEMTRDEADQVVGFVIDTMAGLAVNQGLSLRRFATFKPAPVKGRERRNPQTGGKVWVDEHWQVKVDISPELRDRCTRAHA